VLRLRHLIRSKLGGVLAQHDPRARPRAPFEASVLQRPHDERAHGPLVSRLSDEQHPQRDVVSGSIGDRAALPHARTRTACQIPPGQDVANVAEGSAGIVYAEVTPDGDLYLSITIPSLIVATHGGGTKLPTQRECLEILGCFGNGKVNKLAEIVAGVALAGEISLAAAISSMEWVSSHETYGRNR
jgi:hypothetical protein